MKTSEYKELFLSESQEILASLSKNLVELEKDPSNAELLNEIFRQSHTLKGMAGSMGYDGIVKLSHNMEDILDQLRGKGIKVEKNIIDLLFQSVDRLEELIRAVRTDEEGKVDVTTLVRKLEGIAGEMPREKAEEKFYELKTPKLETDDINKIIKKKEEGYIFYKVTITLDESCKMREPRAFMIVKAMEAMGEVVKSSYACDILKTRKIECRFELLFLTNTPIKQMKKKIEEIPDVSEVVIERTEDEGRAKHGTKDEGRIESHKPVEVQTIRVGLDKLDSLMNVVGELVINKIRLTQISQGIENKALVEAITQMGRLTSDLQMQMMLVRLVPLAYLFDRFPRMVRDLAGSEKKEVDLEIRGSEIGLDRTILDEINDPLIHILRNAVSHGIEGQDEREKLKKPRLGKIILSAHRERNFVIIEVSDDGRGVDPNKIREVAVKKKILSSEEVSRLSDKEVLLLITTPGFSITEKVTEVSGRGVGMNTVRTKVEAIGGALTIDSVPGNGSRFTLKLPLTMAIIQALLVGIKDEIYCIPLSNIAETIKISASDIKTMEHHEIVSYRDTVLPLVRLREKLGFTKDEEFVPRPSSVVPRIPVLVVEVGYKRAGLIVDKLLGQQEVVIKMLTAELKNIKGIAGATILGSGKVALIVDVPSLI